MARCSFIGHRDFCGDSFWKEKITNLITYLIKNCAVDSFYVESKSQFTYFCSNLVRELKKIYPFLKLVYVWGEWLYSNESVEQSMLKYYDEIFKPECFMGAGRNIYVKRNQFLIDFCDIIIFYFDNSIQNKEVSSRKYFPRKVRSGTRIAYEYAIKKKKKIINVFDKCELQD